MNILEDIIQGMNKEQVRYYKLFASRTNKDNSRKDIKLFDSIRRNGKGNREDGLFKNFYSDKDKNSFYRLKNRLLQDVLKSISVQHFADDEVIHILNLVALERYFFKRNELSVVAYLLKKAEAKAKEIEGFELLDIIYTDYIKLSHENVAINPEIYINLRKQNQQKIHQVRIIDDILAAVSYRLKVTQNFSLDNNPVLDLLEKTVDDFTNDPGIKQNAKLRFKLYDAVSQILLQRRDYPTLEDYLLKTYRAFEKEKLFTKETHNTKLQMITYIVNTLFKNNKLKQSLEYAEKLKNALDEYHQMLYDKYIFFYYNSLVINYSKLNPDKAISILEDLKDNEKIKSSSYYQLFVYLNLSVLYFDKKIYNKSIKNLTRLYLLDDFKNTDLSLRFKISMAELIIRYETGDESILLNKIEQVRKDFKDLLVETDYHNETKLIELLRAMIEPDGKRSKSKLISMAKEIYKEKPAGEGDAEIINYNEWLKEKFPTLVLNK